MLTQYQLKEVLRYDPSTGVFSWLKSSGTARIGDVAGGKHSSGYIHIKICRNTYKAHRLAWLYMTGCWPTKYLDHKNGIRDCNIWVNLRECTQSQNMFNAVIRTDNISGHKGVSWDKDTNKWRARARLNGKLQYLGRFATKEQAIEVRQSFAKLHHGEFFKEIL